MAQATVESASLQKSADSSELPDPVHPPSASAASTDDLLAQLAGAEIDRMLAAADTDRPPTEAAQPSASGITGAVPPAAIGSPPPQAAISAQLDDLFAQLTDSDKAQQIAPQQQEKIAAASSAVAPNSISNSETANISTPQFTAAITPEPRRDRPLPLSLRPLAWLSAPLDAFPESVRDTIGKIAILTTVNALFVLVYLLFFRRH